MLQTCAQIGVTPLTQEEFETEDRRILVAWQHRRHRMDDTTKTFAPRWGVY